MHEIFKQNYVLTGNKNREQQSCNVTVNFKQRTDVRVARNHFDFVFQLSQRTPEYVRVWPPPNFLSPYILRVTPTLSHENNGSHLRLKFWVPSSGLSTVIIYARAANLTVYGHSLSHSLCNLLHYLPTKPLTQDATFKIVKNMRLVLA